MEHPEGSFFRWWYDLWNNGWFGYVFWGVVIWIMVSGMKKDKN